MLNKRISSFENKLWLSSPTMHGEELKYMTEAYQTNWMSTVGPNIETVEEISAKKTKKKYAVALSSGTSAIHLSVKCAGEKLYGKPLMGHGTLEGKHVFCSDLTFIATVNPVVYEGGIPVFIDSDAETWNMDPLALEKAFEIYPEVKLVVCVELFGFPGHIDEIKRICEKHGALLIEDSAESLGSKINGRACGSFGDYTILSYNGNKIITGTSGGCFLTDDLNEAKHARKWATQSREQAPWYQHEELGYNYRMSNVIAGVVLGQYPYLDEHISRKKAIYERYQEGLKDLPIKMMPYDEKSCHPNFWLSTMIIDRAAMCEQTRTASAAYYQKQRKGTSCPTEILDHLFSLNAEGRPIWKPLHRQPMYHEHDFISYKEDVDADIFERGLCLPSDIKMTVDEQERIVEVIKACFEV